MNRIEARYAQGLSSRGRGTVKVMRNLEPRLSPLGGWRLAPGFRLSLELGWGPALAQSLARDGLARGSAVEARCLAYRATGDPERLPLVPRAGAGDRRAARVELVAPLPVTIFCALGAPETMRQP